MVDWQRIRSEQAQAEQEEQAEKERARHATEQQKVEERRAAEAYLARYQRVVDNACAQLNYQHASRILKRRLWVPVRWVYDVGTGFSISLGSDVSSLEVWNDASWKFTRDLDFGPAVHGSSMGRHSSGEYFCYNDAGFMPLDEFSTRLLLYAERRGVRLS